MRYREALPHRFIWKTMIKQGKIVGRMIVVP